MDTEQETTRARRVWQGNEPRGMSDHDERPVVIGLRDVVFRRRGAVILDQVSWTVRAGQRWVVIGPNGAGKTTALRFAGARELPVAGEVTVLGERIGTVDLRVLRQRIGYLSPELLRALRPTMTAIQAVVTGIDATLAHWRQEFDDAQWERAGRRLDAFDCGHLCGHTLDTLSDGERQRVVLARALVAEPELLLLDEPSARLDLLGRERLVETLTKVSGDDDLAAIVIVTHHLEEVPPGFTHALLLAGGRVVAAGTIGATLTDANVSAAFGAPLDVSAHGGRYSARLRGA
jgi:iron complex transport system ATP-binding protein